MKTSIRCRPSKIRRIPISLGLASLLLAGCMVGPKYVKPTAPTAPEFKESPPESFKESGGWKSTKPSDQTIRGKWWELFRDLELNALEDQLTSPTRTSR
jgi:outer membrane protein TolC